MSAASGGTASGNAVGLKSDARREGLSMLAITLPAVLLVALLVLLPMSWLSWLSFVDESGAFTLENYTRIFVSGAYIPIIINTFIISFVVTLLVSVLGYPIAYLMAQSSPRVTSFLLTAVLLPYWTPVLVRTYGWMAILQRNGPLNEALLALGVVNAPVQFLYQTSGAVIGMTQIMLPYLIIPVYIALRGVDKDYLRAAAGLGASPTVAFIRIYLPLSLPGFAAGVLLVFILSIGFYVVPALMGGGRVTMIAMRIERSVMVFPNWGAASALAIVLLVATLVLLAISVKLARLGGNLR
ncbi:ABC transporter permease [Mesorhizobium sanjuanii]|uniref:ABC transporter permease n=1 Tax=Mesorhizobium sanjuanii TaxID=2037900 RepID=A0A2A6FLD7_9HYPH|nr:ABC transporter permease [Mesorhizobium sanjuanii]PDQ22644.1 ABC transporter permease [Mesorhizobium sanjuanii]